MIDAREPALAPLKRISPSRVTAFQGCPLRELFRAADAPRLLAAVGAAHLGTVIHELLERAGVTPPSVSAAEQLFDGLVSTEEEKMLRDERTRTAVPLSRSVRDFEVRKRRALHAAVNSPRRVHLAHRAPSTLLTGTEVWVQSRDGLVGGFIDEVLVRVGVVIRDHKSGTAIHRDTTAFRAAEEQLMLYAALYADTTGTWPVAAEIVPVAGAAIEVALDPDACQEVLRRARMLMVSCNETVLQLPRPEADFQLGRPSPATCRQCDYRPMCFAYRAARTPLGEWSRDVIGTITARDKLKNGTIFFLVEDANSVFAVRGVTADHARLDDLEHLQPGASAGFFNLIGGRDGASFTATQTSTAVAFRRDSV